MSRHTTLLLVNDKARNGRRYASAVLRALPAGTYDVSPVYGTSLPRFDRYKRILIVGGDGAVRHIASFVRGGPPVGLIPAGTGNNLSQALRIPQKPDEAIALALSGSSVRPIDVFAVTGAVKECYITTHGALGIGAQIAYTYDRLRKTTLGRVCCYPCGEMIYRFLSLYELAVGARPRYNVRISFPDREIEGCFAAIFLGNWAGIGGRFFPCPGAQPDDGLIHLCLISATLSRLQSFYLMRHIARGTHVLSDEPSDPGRTQEVQTLLSDRVKLFRSPGPVGISFLSEIPSVGLLADGDLFPVGRDLTFEVLRRRLPIVVPG